ncbi:CocE/NonD family hydrolase [Nocardia asiatica]|uniref:CocE/NonD family hydrolase n=1 Tax=Nocardia asiatica TaxID=209252 RepID=UPI000311574F|nr:CocE/NonD family hydrolase [Nocardia asiatica]
MTPMSQGDSIVGTTSAQLARISAEGVWDAQGQVRPEAVQFASNLVTAVRERGGEGLVPTEVADLVSRALRVAVPTFPRIEASDGIGLSAHMLRQTTDEPCPLVVFPAGWTPVGWPLFEYAYLTLAVRGYHVLAYTPRGIGWSVLPGTNLPWFGTSEGTVDVAGPKDREDGSTVLEYAIEALAPSGVAFMGESYGSGISQLVAAHDEDVDVVVALSTWGNLATSLYDNGTRHVRAVQALIGLTGGELTDKFDQRAQEILAKFDEGKDMDPVVDWGTERSPESYIGTRRIPTFFSNTWHEGLFPVNEMLETFEKLPRPKRLNMWIGDHAAPEGPGLIAPPAPGAGPNVPLLEAYAWLDHHLKGEDNGVDAWPEISNQVMFTYVTTPGSGDGNVIIEPARREEKASWGDVTTDTESLTLTDTREGGDGALIADVTSGWEREFTVGELPEIVAMDKLMTTGQEEWAGNPRIYRTDEIDRGHALVWTTGPLLAVRGGVARQIRGIPRLQLTVDSTDDCATVVAYLLDVDEHGSARIITHEPKTVESSMPATVAWELQAAAYDVPDGHRLMLVVDGMDPLYSSVNTVGARITISSPQGAPCCLELPLG